MAADDSFIRYSDFIVPDDSIEKLIELLEQVNVHMSKVAQSVPITAEKMTAAIKKVTGVTTDGENALAEMATFIERLEKSYRDLAYAQSDFGKATAVVKEQIKETNQETLSRYKLDKAAKGAIDALNESLRREKVLYDTLSEADRLNTAIGGEQIKIIRKLTEERAYAQRELNASIGAAQDYVRAQTNMIKQDDRLAALTARYADAATRKRKTHQLDAAAMNTNATSIEGLKARLDQLVASYRKLDESARNSAQGAQMQKDIMNLTAQYEALNATMSGSSLSADVLANASRRLALAQSAEAGHIAEINAQADIANFKIKARIQLETDLEKAEERLRLAQSGEAAQLAATNQDIAEQNRLNQTRAALMRANIPIEVEARNQVDFTKLSYNQLNAIYEANALELKKLSLSQKTQRDELVAYQQQVAALMTTMEAGISAGRGGMQRLGKNFDGLSYSISQLLREAPAAAVSMNTFFLAISNNVPMVVDQIRKVILANKQLRAAGTETVSVVKQIGKSLISFNAIMMLVVTLFTFFGEDMLKWAKKLITGNKIIISTTKALKNLKKQIKETSDEFGEGLSILYRLQLQWKNLRTEAEKTKWIKNNQSEFSKLGIAINNITDAENVFVKNTAAVIESMRLRAIAAAGEQLATEEYKKAMQEGASRGALEADYRVHEQSVRGQVRAQYLQGQQIGSKVWSRDENGRLRLQVATQTELNKLQESALANDKERAKQAKEIAAAHEREQQYIQNGMQYTKIALGYTQDVIDVLNSAGIKPEDQKGGDKSGSGSGRGVRSLDEYIRNMSTTLIKKANDAAAKAIEDGFEQRKAQIEANYQNELAELQKMYSKNEDILNKRGAYAKTTLTPEQRNQIETANKGISQILTNLEVAKNQELEKLEREHNIQMNKLIEERYQYILNLGKATADEQLDLQKKILAAQKKAEIEVYQKRNQDDRIRDEDGNDIGLQLINQTYAKKEEDLVTKHMQDMYRIIVAGLDNELEAVQSNSDEELSILLKKLEAERQIALAENRLKPASEQASESSINKAFDTKVARTKGSHILEGFEQRQGLQKARFDSVEHTTTQIKRFELEQEKAMWEEKVKLAKAGMLNWSKVQIDEAKQMIANIETELNKLPRKFDEILADIGEYGIGGTILKHLGFDNDAIDAFDMVFDAIKDNISSLIDAWNEAAQAAVDAADKQVEAAKSVLDAELEARNNGYANSVVTAQKELALSRKKREEAIKEKEKAQKAQLAIDTITRTSSLITATAQLWSSVGGVPIIGPALALAAIATMWGSFAAAKIKAAQVASQSEQYGEGGLEFLEGGSHASGNDIDLGVENKRHKRMRAEGGEALAIISKKRTRQYRDILPGIIESLNKGTFEQAYMQSFAAPIGLQLAGFSQPTDISKLERDVNHIKEELGYRYYSEPDRTIVKKGNLTRIIRK
nr:MAG TPA: tail length tape measure protein [Caudoviricetes sp.]